MMSEDEERDLFAALVEQSMKRPQPFGCAQELIAERDRNIEIFTRHADKIAKLKGGAVFKDWLKGDDQ